MLSLAGVPLPLRESAGGGRALDGMDLSPLLLSETPGAEPAHGCIMFYNSPQSQLGPAGAASLDSLSAVRCGDHKVYWFIDRGYPDQPLPKEWAFKAGKQSLSRPVIFDVAHDWGEEHPIAVGTAVWTAAKEAAAAARAAHLKTLGWAPSQTDLGEDIAYSICSDPRSQEKLPQFPNCTINPEFWENPFCLCGGKFKNCTLCS